MPISIYDSATIPGDRRPELEAAVVAARRHSSKRFEGWIAATEDSRKFAVRITPSPNVDIIVPLDWNATHGGSHRACARGHGKLMLEPGRKIRGGKKNCHGACCTFFVLH